MKYWIRSPGVGQATVESIVASIRKWFCSVMIATPLNTA